MITYFAKNESNDPIKKKYHLTNGRDYSETVHARVDEGPALDAGVGGNSGLVRLVQLFLELHELSPGHALPVVLLHVVAVVPQAIQKVALDPLDPALVERLEGTLGESKSQTSQAAYYQGYYRFHDAQVTKFYQNLYFLGILTTKLVELREYGEDRDDWLFWFRRCFSLLSFLVKKYR